MYQASHSLYTCRLRSWFAFISVILRSWA